ncbi:MAG: hypothetical protein NT085_01980 [candidate division SR1 bacterium]|nr:hypothetical protein [candidate division SR1 bacterium]
MGTGVGVVLDKSSWSLASLFGGTGFVFWMNVVAILLVFFRVVSIIRVTKDIINRTNSFSLQVISILFVTFLTPLVGLPLYFLIRPIMYKSDRIPRREACASNLVPCYNCNTLNPKEYVCCIACGERLKIKCKECGNNYAHSFAYCNICGAPNID